MEIFRVKNLSFSYPEADKKALDDVNFSVNSGEFITLCGKSGSSKTTLLKLLKPQLSPKGDKNGEILYKGNDLYTTENAVTATKIGYVMQNTETQIVCDTVIKELAFGLENMCANPFEIKRRIAEISAFFGIEEWVLKNTNELSGGQKQIVSLASVLVMNPEVIILDEPTSQLDPVATDTFFSLLEKINRQFGITIILSEHNLEQCFPMSDRVIFLDEGKIVCDDTPKNACRKILKTDLKKALPSATRIFENENNLPISVREGREIILGGYEKTTCPIVEKQNDNEEIISLKDVWFRYEKNGKDVLKGLDLSVKKGEILAILGSNGSGKTTLLNVISKLRKAYKGSVKLKNTAISSYKGNSLYRGIVGFLPQNPKTVFSNDTVREDFLESCKVLSKDESVIDEISKKLSISHLLDRHPFDLSGGEIQKCALGRVMISNPEILLLDEPTKGLDAFYKSELSEIFTKLSEEGKTILIVTHDLEFSANTAHSCAMLFDGEIVCKDTPQKFFYENYFYTTSCASIAKDVVKNAVTVSQVTENLRKK